MNQDLYYGDVVSNHSNTIRYENMWLAMHHRSARDPSVLNAASHPPYMAPPPLHALMLFHYPRRLLIDYFVKYHSVQNVHQGRGGSSDQARVLLNPQFAVDAS